MWYQFFLENLHFGINLACALVFFAAFWLYFDAWTVNKRFKDTFRIIGFLLLSISFLFHASFLEISNLETPFGGNFNVMLVLFTKIPGYLLILISEIVNPPMKKPNSMSKEAAVFGLPELFTSTLTLAVFIYPLLAIVVGFLYLRRATIGLEDHLKPVALSFFCFAFYELFSLASIFRHSDNVSIFNLVAPFGILWIIEHLILLLATVFIGKWVFGYLLKRFQSQLFMIYTTTIVVIFLITTLAFTTLLLKDLEINTLSHLETDVNILQYSIDSKKAEALSDAQVVAQNPDVLAAVVAGDRKSLKTLAGNIFLTKKQSSLVILGEGGVVLARAEDPERVGDSLSDDPLVKRALRGDSVSTVVTRDGVVAPTVSIKSAAPIKVGDTVGAVVVGTDIDNAFVDGVKNATKLDASIYGDNIRSATTFVAPDGKTRWIGVKEENSGIKSRVLKDGKLFVGSVNILNTPFHAAFLPMKDIDNVTVGMLFVGSEQVNLLQAAGRSIEFTFLISVLLLALSIIPAYYVSRFLNDQIK